MDIEEQSVEASQDSVYVIYPRHLKWLMQQNKLTVPEICTALGLTSIQDWFAMQRDENEPVRKMSIAQAARIYLKNPHLLHPPTFELEAFIARTFQVFDGDEITAKLAMEAVFHKKWTTIERWLEDDTKVIDLAVRRYVELMMKLDDNEFSTMLVSGIVNTHVQINARDVITHIPTSLADTKFETLDTMKFSIHSVIEIIPTPGRRINKKDYKAPEGSVDLSSAVAASMSKSKLQGDDVLPMSDEMRAAQEKAKQVWGKLSKSGKEENDQ